MTVAQYLDWWVRHKQGHEEQLLYLKDWHFVNEFPDYKAGPLSLHAFVACIAF